MDNVSELFRRLHQRTPRRFGGVEVERFELGTRDDLDRIENMAQMCETYFSVYIVQPGVAISEVSPDQLQLLGVTQSFLVETREVDLGVIFNDM